MATVRRGRPTSKPTTRKAAPAKPATKAVASKDVSGYASKPATEYHKAFARWIVQEVGLDLSGLSVKAAFLKGVSIATAARPAFNSSEFIEEWREKTGAAKPGRKPASETATKRRKPEPEPEEDDDDFEDEIEEDEDFEEESDDEDFDEDDDSDEDDSDDDDEDFDDEEEEEEPAPAPRKRPTKSAPAKPAARGTRTSRSAPAKKAAPAKRTRAASKPAQDDDDFIF